MGFIVKPETRERIGEMLFNMLTAAMKEVNVPMTFASWQAVDMATKRNYMTYVNQIAAYVETQPDVVPVPEVKPEAAAEAKAEEASTFGADDGKDTAKDSPLLEQVLKEGKPVTLAPVPPKNPRECVCGKVAKSPRGLKMHQDICEMVKAAVPA